MFKHSASLFLLVTDEGYLDKQGVVWERLDSVNGGTVLCDAEHRPYVAPPPGVAPPGGWVGWVWGWEGGSLAGMEPGGWVWRVGEGGRRGRCADGHWGSAVVWLVVAVSRRRKPPGADIWGFARSCAHMHVNLT